MGSRERIISLTAALLTIAVVMLGLELKWALKSPTPAEWNQYSNAANEHLYNHLNKAKPTLSPVVSHRGGSVPGNPSASPLVRLDDNYALGQRLFELDFSWTSDDQLVIEHDWNNFPTIPTLAKYLAAAPARRASLSMLYSWLSDHPDAFIVTDCKKRSLEGCARIRMERPDLVPQFIPQIYQFKDYALVQSQGFRNIILTLYRCYSDEPADSVAQFVAQHELFALTIPESRADDTDLLTQISRLGIPVYVHTINDAGAANQILARGVYGIYSDRLTAVDLDKWSQPLTAGASSGRH